MTKRPNYVFDDELYHHGIKGQHWGDRRFQNEDGSWTPEGRERYGKGGRLFQIFKRNKSEQQIKADQQKAKAKISYNTQKYKADLKLKAQKDKIARAAQEEREKIKQQAKNDEIARKEQNRLDRKQAKLDSKLAKEQNKAQDTATLKEKLNRTKKYSMSDDELERSIKRLKLEVEYNKQYALAASPNSALAKADRFFEGPTGQMVQAVAVAAIPKVAEQFAKAAATNAFKYANKEDRDKAAAEARLKEEEVKLKAAEVANKEQSTANDKAKYDADVEYRKAETRAKDAESTRLDREIENQFRLDKAKTLSEIGISRQKQKNENKKFEQDYQAEYDRLYGHEYTDRTGTKRRSIGQIAVDAENAENKSIAERKKAEAEQARIEAMNRQDVADREARRVAKSARSDAKTASIIAANNAEQAKTNRYNVETAQKVDNHLISMMQSLKAGGLTLQDIAAQTGVSISTVKKYIS